MKKTAWITISLLSILIGLYPIVYFVIDSRKFGLLSTKSIEVLNNIFWNTAFYGHITLGGLALLIGWLQFNHKLRIKKPKLHRNIGKTYIISVIISGICGIFIGFYTTGGIVSASGFISLALLWLISTVLSFTAVKKNNIEAHKKLIIYSYACCFAAVTLRIWLPLLTIYTGNFIPAYKIVAWLCWIPNIIVAYFINQNKNLIK